MNEFEFAELLLQTAYALEDREPELMAMSGIASIQGVDILIEFDAEQHGGCICCYIDLGEIDRYAAGDMSQQLLSLNLLSGSRTTGVYALDEETGHPVFIVHLLDLDTIDGPWLAQALRVYAKEARQVRSRILSNWTDELPEFVQDTPVTSSLIPFNPV